MKTVRDIMSKEFVALEKADTVSSLIGRIKETGATQACITDNGELAGIFSPQALLKSRVDVAALKLARLARPSPQLSPSDDLLHAAAAMHDANTGMLPVVENGKLVGVVHALDLLKHLWDLPELEGITVKDIRHPQPATIGEGESIDTALSTMHDLHLDSLPVVDDRGRVSGFLAHKDVLERYYAHRLTREYGQRARGEQTRAFEAERPDVPELAVANFMNTKTIVTTTEDAPLRQAIERMVLERVPSLLILEDHAPKAIVTHKHILEAVINSQIPENRDIKYVGVEKLGVDSYHKVQIAKIASRHFEKLQRMVHNQIELMVHIKERQRQGERHRYSIRLRVTYPGATVPSTNAIAWDVRTALQDAFTRLESNLSNQFKRNRKEILSERKTGREMPGTDMLPGSGIA